MSKPVDFVLLAHPRSGSNLLSRALDEHIAVEMSGEIFDGTHDEIGAGLPDGVPPYRRGMVASDYLTRNIFPPARRPGIEARGFKLFYEHARADAPGMTLWPQLIGDRRIRVIHLVRRNLFDCLVSLEVALRSGEWYRPVETPDGEETRDGPPPVAPFAISAGACQDYFGRIVSWRMWADEAFASHPALTIDYAELCADFPGTMAQIFGFIGVAPQIVAPSLTRQAQLSPAQQIVNYAELQRFFRYSLFAGFFRDTPR